jgi:endonuclease YncB( thermonuclease family)
MHVWMCFPMCVYVFMFVCVRFRVVCMSCLALFSLLRASASLTRSFQGGNFLGDAFFRKQSVALALLEEGWAQVSRGSERHPSLALYQKAELAAQQAKKGMWLKWTPPPAPVEGAPAPHEEERAGETCKLLVTEVVDGSLFYCQRVAEADQTALDSLMAELQRLNAGAAAQPATKWSVGSMACVRYAEDGLWYRVRLVEPARGQGRWCLHYVDFGNQEVREERDLRPVPAALQSVPPQAVRCHLALLRVPTPSQDCGHESAQALKELTWGKVLMASIEWRVQDEEWVTLGDIGSGININKELVRMGLATLMRDGPAGGRRFEKPLAQLWAAQEEAKASRLSLWRYGDILEAESDDEY